MTGSSFIMRVINGNLFFSIYNGNAFKIINPHCEARQSHLQLQSILLTDIRLTLDVALLAGGGGREGGGGFVGCLLGTS